MVVSVISAISGKADMAIGNIVGSNIFNTFMILGVTALIAPIVITKSNLKKDISLNVLVTSLLIILGIWGLGNRHNELSFLDGALMLGIFVWYL